MATTSPPPNPSDIEPLLETDIRTELPSSDVATVITHPPFVHAPGLFNVRDLSDKTQHSPLLPHHIYRSGALTHITDEGKAALVTDLGIATIFDLRRTAERIRAPAPEIEGVKTVWAKYDNEAGQQVNPMDFAQGDGGVSGFVKMYMGMLEWGAPTLKMILEHVRDYPDRPFLFHCSAGKDRTGVIAAILLLLAGSSEDAIVHDYLLTRVGVEPARQALFAFLNAASNQPPEVITGLTVLSSVPGQAMRKFLESIQTEYEGGVRGYLVSRLGFSEQEVDVIQENLKSRREGGVSKDA